jgi:hypothetical protein
MANIWRSFWGGWGAAARLWPAVLLVYLVDAALAAVLVAPAASHLGGVFGRSTMSSDLLGPVTTNLLLEVSGGMEPLSLPWQPYLLAPVAMVLIGTFLRGGILGALASGSSSFHWSRFLSDCVRFFGRFVVLLLLFAPALLVGFLLVAGASLRITAPASTLLTWLAVVGLFGVMLVMAMDYARVSLVTDPGRSVFRHFGRGIAFVFRRFPHVLALGLAFALVAVLLAGLYPALVQLSPLFGALLPALLLQQVIASLSSWQRIAMLGGEMTLFRREARIAANQE